MNVEDIPDLNPKVEAYFMHCLCRKVDTYVGSVFKGIEMPSLSISNVFQIALS